MDLVFERRGSGEPLVLIHGLGHRRQAWDPVVERLATEREVITVDLHGFGESPGFESETDYNMTETVRLFAEFFAELGLDRPHVAGNSLGGAIALELGAAGLASSVTALSPGGFFSAWERKWAINMLRIHRVAVHAPTPILRLVSQTGLTRRLAYSMILCRADRLTPQQFVDDSLALRSATGFAATARAGSSYYCEAVPTVPTTIAWGTKDRLLFPRQMLRAAKRLPGAHIIPLPGLGHVPMHDDPKLVARVLLDGSAPADVARTGAETGASRVSSVA